MWSGKKCGPTLKKNLRAVPQPPHSHRFSWISMYFQQKIGISPRKSPKTTTFYHIFFTTFFPHEKKKLTTCDWDVYQLSIVPAAHVKSRDSPPPSITSEKWVSGQGESWQILGSASVFKKIGPRDRGAAPHQRGPIFFNNKAVPRKLCAID